MAEKETRKLNSLSQKGNKLAFTWWMPMGKDPRDGVFEFVKTRPNEPGALRSNNVYPSDKEIYEYMQENEIDYDTYES